MKLNQKATQHILIVLYRYCNWQ